MIAGASLLAAYLEQRLRIGEPGIIPSEGGSEEFLRAVKSVAAGARAAGARKAGAHASGHQSHGLPLAQPRSGTAVGVPSKAPDPAVASYDELREIALSCTRCRLSKGRTQVAFSDGTPAARLMVVGEAPGAREDATGLPFVGQAGKLLDLMLASVGLSRKESVYICNVLKCRPPGNRNPRPDEIDACAPLLKRQIELVSPAVILAAGTFAAKWLTASPKALGKLRGRVYSYLGVPLIVTYHPAALLRNPAWSRAAWDDLQLLCQLMDGL